MTVENTKVLGKITICMEKEHTHGKMEEDMMANIIWIRNMDTGCIFGQIAVVMRVSGKMANNMEKESIFSRIVQ